MSKFAVAISGLPSPSVSPISIPYGPLPVPVLKSALAAKLIVPEVDVFWKTETVPLSSFAVAISSLVSPSKSPMATANGLVPVANVVGTARLMLKTEEVLRKIEISLEPPFVTTISA